MHLKIRVWSYQHWAHVSMAFMALLTWPHSTFVTLCRCSVRHRNSTAAQLSSPICHHQGQTLGLSYSDHLQGTAMEGRHDDGETARSKWASRISPWGFFFLFFVFLGTRSKSGQVWRLADVVAMLQRASADGISDAQLTVTNPTKAQQRYANSACAVSGVE